MTDGFVRHETFPEVKYVVADREEDANLIQVGGQTFFDMKELESVSINDFDAILEAGIKMGMAIAELRKEKR